MFIVNISEAQCREADYKGPIRGLESEIAGRKVAVQRLRRLGLFRTTPIPRERSIYCTRQRVD